MPRRVYLIPILSCVVIPIAGCGEITSRLLGKENVRPQTSTQESDVRFLSLEDPECLNQKATETISSATIYQWDGRISNPKTVTLNGRAGTSGEFVTANVIGSRLNVEETTKCIESVNGDKNCKMPSVTNQSSQVWLKICRSNGTYKRDSIEAVTLTGLYFIEQSYEYYSSIPGSKAGLKKSYLVPQIKSTRELTNAKGQTKTAIDSDNASFSSETRNEGSFGVLTLYPTSSGFFKKSNNNFWEIPFVLQHEFGHHVLDYYITSALALNGLSLHHFVQQRDHWILPMPGDRQKNRSYQLAEGGIQMLALSGIHELFADLFAHFAGGASADQLLGVMCLDVTRDPSSSKTKAGSMKGIDTSRIDIYEGRAQPAPGPTNCGEPTYDEEHDIAIALGYPIATFIKQVTKDQNAADASKLLLQWAAAMSTFIGQKFSQVTTDNLIRELVLSAKALPGNMTDACSALKPMITGLPQASNSCTE